MKNKIGPLVERVYQVKKPVMNFFCPLCRTERALIYKSKLEFKNYIHIILISTVLGLALYPLMEWKAGFNFFVVWATYEMANKFLFRKNIPCPHCGFDATWYKRDVRVARKMVANYWARKNGTESELNEENGPGAMPNIRPQQQEFETTL